MVPKPLRFMRGGVVRLLSSKSERALRKGMEEAFFRGQETREPERLEGPGEHEVPTRTNPSGARSKGHGFFSGMKSLERGYEVRQGFVGKCKSGREIRKGSLDHWEGAKL